MVISANTSWLYNVSDLIYSAPINIVLTTMNVKLFAAYVLLVERGVFLVSDDYKLAYALQNVDNLVFG